MLSIIVFSIGFSALFGLFISRIITRPLKNIQSLMENAEHGDFTVQGSYKSKDEIGLLTKSFNEMIDGLRRLIGQVAESSEHVAASSEQLTSNAEQTNETITHIATTIQEVASGTEQQVQSIEDASDTINDMSSGIQQIATSTQNVASTIEQTSEKALEGNKTIQTAVQQIHLISNTVTGLANLVKGLGERSKEIEQIIEL